MICRNDVSTYSDQSQLNSRHNAVNQSNSQVWDLGKPREGYGKIAKKLTLAVLIIVGSSLGIVNQ